MSEDDGAASLPFADCELATDIHSDLGLLQKPKYHHKIKTNKKSKQQPNRTQHEQDGDLHNIAPHIYFENTEEENNFLTLIPYTGPCNTSHLSVSLHLPQLISSVSNESTVSVQRFIEDYDQTITYLKPTFETLSLSIYIRFGILYIMRPTTIPDQPMPLQDFVFLRNEGKQVKTAFYTCKGVTSPKHLLTAITKLNYQPISSNTYSYDIQLYGTKANQYPVLHFQYDEQLQCRAVYFRPNNPVNFDFIRNKTSSLFRSIDHSYSDIFDFRIQLNRSKHLSKTDSNVLAMLRGVPIDRVLFLDPSTHALQIASKLHKFVKYLKCTRSSNYQHLDEQILISIGTYEEYQLNSNGQCELLMKASNTMTIEFLDREIIPSGQKLHDIGIWFSTLCGTCVDLPTTRYSSANKSYKWFSDIAAYRTKTNSSIKQMNVSQLTTYATQKSTKTYTSEELAFVKKILREETLANIFLNANGDKCSNRHDLEDIYESIRKRLKTTAAPSANEALIKLQRAYDVISKELIE